MAITKIVAGIKGSPTNTSGAGLAESINATIDVVESVTSGNSALKVITDANKAIIESTTIGNQKLRDDIDALPIPASDTKTAAQLLFDKQADENIELTYIVAGDSHRDNSYNNMIAYYGVLLNQIGVTVVDNAESGQSGLDWLNNDTGGAGTTLQQAIDATPNTGATTLLEYSFGVNDRGTNAEIKAALKGGIEAYLAAKPDATVVLCSPIRTTAKHGLLITVYEEIAAELGLQLVKPHPVIEPYDNDPAFKQDTEHLNAYGSQRLLHFILSNIVSEKVRSSIKIPDLGVPTAPATTLNVIVQPNYWSSSVGELQTEDSWRCSKKITVEPNYKINIEHRGDQFSVFWYDGAGGYMFSTASTVVSGDLRQVTVPTGAFQMAFNITGDGDTWDALGFTPTAEYVIEAVTYMTPEEVNVNMSAGLPRFNTLPVDSEGKTGADGQFLMSIGAGKTKWSAPIINSTAAPTNPPPEDLMIYNHISGVTITTYVNINGSYVPTVV